MVRPTTYPIAMGQRFERLVVTGRTTSPNNRTVYECLCDCGSVTVVYPEKLRKGRTRSCGCLMNEVRGKNGGNAWEEQFSRIHCVRFRKKSVHQPEEQVLF